MSNDKSSGTSSEWKLNFNDAFSGMDSGNTPPDPTPHSPPTAPPLFPRPNPSLSTALPGSSGIVAPPKAPAQLSASVREASQNVIKYISVFDAFMGLPPDLQRRIVRLCDFADDPFAFDEQLKLNISENAFFLPRLNDWLLQRPLRVKILRTDAPDDGWLIEEVNLADVIKMDLRYEILSVRKVSGDSKRFPIGSVHKVPLYNILPFNLRK